MAQNEQPNLYALGDFTALGAASAGGSSSAPDPSTSLDGALAETLQFLQQHAQESSVQASSSSGSAAAPVPLELNLSVTDAMRNALPPPAASTSAGPSSQLSPPLPPSQANPSPPVASTSNPAASPSDDSLSPQREPSTGPSSSKIQKAAARKERNRLAAQRSRDKKAAKYGDMEAELASLKEENEVLKVQAGEVESLRLRVRELERVIRELRKQGEGGVDGAGDPANPPVSLNFGRQ
ncbi:hypothetical protein JCM8547_008951 [Rhodosporidiobolus lusitaniae]